MDHDKFKNCAIGFQSIVLAFAVIAGGIWTAYTFQVLGQVSKARAELKEIEAKLKQDGLIDVELSSETFAFPKGDGRILSITVGITNSGNKPVDIDFSRWESLSVYPVVIEDNGNMGFGPKVNSLISATGLPRVNKSEYFNKLINAAKKEGRLDKIIALDKKFDSYGFDVDLTELVSTIEKDQVLSKHPSMTMLRKGTVIPNITGLTLRPGTTDELAFLVYVPKTGPYLLIFDAPITQEELLDSQLIEQEIKLNKALYRWSDRLYVLVE